MIDSDAEKEGGVVNILIYGMLILGISLMVVNIIKYRECMISMRDVLTAGVKRLKIWKNMAMMLLLFFFVGYVFVTVLGHPDLMTASILFGGSIFVAIMVTFILRGLETVKERSIDVAEVLFGVIDARDPNLNGHSRHVQNLTMLLFEYVPYSRKKDINEVSLEYAALMHDVGKLGVPENILNKPAKLNDEEWEVMRQHPDIGTQILNPLTSFSHIMPWILYHHERIDGKGYHGLKGDDIPYASRMIAVADTYSAITMRRSYKAPHTHEEAITMMKEVAGTQLDEELVEIFAQIPKDKIMKCTAKMLNIN